jgi:hypothetical protein
VGWRRYHAERLIGEVAGYGVDDLQIVHGRGDRHRRVTELAEDGEFRVAVAFALATTPPVTRDGDRPTDDRVGPRHVGTKTVMPRRSASARSGRCGESGLTLMAVALFHGSISRSRKAATSALAKFGMRPCGGNGKRATPSARSLSQTHCRAALLSVNSPAMTAIGAARPDAGQGRNLFLDRTGRPDCG